MVDHGRQLIIEGIIAVVDITYDLAHILFFENKYCLENSTWGYFKW